MVQQGLGLAHRGLQTGEAVFQGADRFRRAGALGDKVTLPPEVADDEATLGFGMLDARGNVLCGDPRERFPGAHALAQRDG